MASMIFPAGSGKNVVNWMDKVAEQKEEKIGTAAIDIAELRRLAALSDIAPKEDEDVDVDGAETAEKSPVGDEENVPVSEETDSEKDEAEEDDSIEIEIDDEPEAGETEEHEAGESAEFEAGETEEKAETSEAVDQAAAAVEDAKRALDEASEALAGAGAVPATDDEEIAEIPVSMNEDIPEEGSIEVEIETSPDEVPVDDVVVGDEAGNTDVTEDKEEFPALEASSSKFYKIASLSPANKKKLSEYWIKTLGYDSDWVKSLLKDYK